MSIRFNADEVFEMAERMEQNAVAYYSTAAGKVSLPAAKQMFEELASWEKKHERTFHSLREQIVADNEKEEVTFDPYGEALQYLHALSDESVFTPADDPLNKVGVEPSFADILSFAIGKERDSIAFYLGMKEMVPSQLGKDKIDAIIKEEMGHVTLLTGKLRENQ
jgi:rubrerythrin